MKKADIQKRAAKVAAMNHQKRRLTRKENKELIKINQAFNKIQNDFSAFLFGFDWDDITHLQYDDGTEVPISELKMFQDFNQKWIAFCNKWKRDKHHNTPVNENAFHEWAIDNTKTNKNDKRCDFIGSKWTILCGGL